MSLESQIADLVSATNNLIATFNTKKSGIDAAVAAAIAAIPTASKNFYVNQLTGDDTAAGTAAAPLKTIEKAISNTPFGGVVSVYLQTDYQMLANITLDSRFLHLRSDNNLIKRKLTTTYYVISDGTATYLSGFVMYNGAQMMTSDLWLALPSPAGTNPAPTGFVNAFFKTNSAAGTVIAAVKMTACDVTAPADFVGWIVASPNGAIVLEVHSGTFPAGFGGRYVNGVVSGTNPATLPNLLTNLPAL